MDLRQLRYFIAVAEEKSFSRAAKRLHVSQPPLSTHVKSLERSLGVRLLDRNNRGAVLTPAGRMFYDEVRSVFRRLEQACIKARNAGQGDVGTLSVGFVSIADYGILPPALKRFRERFPNVDVELHELTTDAQIEEIRAGRLHLGIALGPVDEADLAFETVLLERLLLAVPTARRLFKAEGSVRLKAVSGESFIIPPRDVAPGLFDVIVGECRANGFAPRISQHARQMQTVIGLVASGMGIALVPSSVKNLKRAGVQYRALRGSTASVELGLLRSRDGGGPLSVRFAAVLKEVACEGRRP
jgi:DNA-binding transcriptional LysR family regulator